MIGLMVEGLFLALAGAARLTAMIATFLFVFGHLPIVNASSSRFFKQDRPDVQGASHRSCRSPPS